MRKEKRLIEVNSQQRGICEKIGEPCDVVDEDTELMWVDMPGDSIMELFVVVIGH